MTDVAPALDGTHLLATWWRVRRGSMFSPWTSVDEGDRLRRDLPTAAELHDAAVEQMSRPWPAGPLRQHDVSLGHGTVRVHLAEHPAPAGPPVVVLPPAPGSGRSVLPLATELAADRTVVVVDYPGHGGSDPFVEEPEGLDDYVDVLEELVRTLRLAPVAVVGVHSGALLALLWEQRVGSSVARLVLDGLPHRDSFRGWDLDAYLPSLAPDIDGTHVLRAWAMASDRMLWSPWCDRTAATAKDVQPTTAEALTDWTVDLLRGAATYHLLYRLVLSHELGDLRPSGTPVLLCRAARDSLAGSFSLTASLLPDAEVVETSGPPSTASAITSFLGHPPMKRSTQ